MSNMIKRDHHIKIMKILNAMDADILKANSCYFGGGTAISLLNDEFRVSVDVDFMCATNEGYAKIRELVFDGGLEPLFKPGLMPNLLREVRADRDGVRAIFEVDGTPIKFEIVREVRIDLTDQATFLPVPTLSTVSLFAEKLLANTDRGLDKSGLSKDMIDLIVMQHNFGNIPKESISLAKSAYGLGIFKAYNQVADMLRNDPERLNACLLQLDIQDHYKKIILDGLMNTRLNQSSIATP